MAKTREEKIASKKVDIVRLNKVLAGLGPEFSEDGVVRTVLRERIDNETKRLRRMLMQEEEF